MIEALKAAWRREYRLNTALAVSLALHLTVVALFSAMPKGSLIGSRVAATAGGQGMRAILRGTPSPEQRQEVRPREISDQPSPERPAKASGSDQARSGALAEISRPSIGPGPDTYTTVETRTVVYSPISSYHPLGELDIRPWIAVHVEPEYPPAAAQRFMSGKVVIRVLINEQGMVDRTIVVSSSPQGFFEIPAQTAFNAARYTPGVKLGKAVKSQLLIEVTFTSAGPPRIVEMPGR